MGTQNKIHEILLSEKEISQVNLLVNEIMSEPINEEEFNFLSRALIYSQELPRRVRELFYDFKLNENYLGLLVKNGNLLLGKEIPPTPQDYIEKEGIKFRVSKSDVIHTLFSCLLGEPIGFKTQRWGHVFNSIIPKKELENVSNSSSGSTYDFKFHSEDGFHPAMADYIGLICLRNIEKAPTVLSSLQGVYIPDAIKRVLFEENFFITSNGIHENVDEKILNQKKSLLFGNYDDPYLRINANLIKLEDYSGMEKEAIEFVLDVLDRNKIEIILETGNCLYIDNFKTVHKRDSFKPNYGNEARWLTRIVMANDLRKTRNVRNEVNSRIITK